MTKVIRDVLKLADKIMNFNRTKQEVPCDFSFDLHPLERKQLLVHFGCKQRICAIIGCKKILCPCEMLHV